MIGGFESSAAPLLAVKQLRLAVGPRARPLPVLDAADLTVGAGEAIGLVGESGSAKTMLCRALIGTLGRHGAHVTGGEIRFRDLELASASERIWRTVRGRRIGYIPQSSLAGLNPVLTVGVQLVESLRVLAPVKGRDADRQALALLDSVKIADAPRVLRARAHELSGGMRQRVMIAAAIAQRPDILIADEPTTALDVTVQRDILRLLGDIRRDTGVALILVSHDLAVIEAVCDRIVVMYAGATVESGPVAAVSTASRHPYTRSLQASRLDDVVPGTEIAAIAGEPASVGRWPHGCRFHPRCPLCIDMCRQGLQPPLRWVGGQQSACLRAETLAP